MFYFLYSVQFILNKYILIKNSLWLLLIVRLRKCIFPLLLDVSQQ